MTVAVDDPRNVRDLSQAMVSAGGRLDLLIEVDVGMKRGGVRSPEEAVALAQQIQRPSRRALARRAGLRGPLMGGNGSCECAVAGVGAAMDYLAASCSAWPRRAFACEVVSAGGTGTYDITSLASAA